MFTLLARTDKCLGRIAMTEEVAIGEASPPVPPGIWEGKSSQYEWNTTY